MTELGARAIPVTSPHYAWIYAYPVAVILFCVLWVAWPWRWQAVLTLPVSGAISYAALTIWNRPEILLALAQGTVLALAGMGLLYTNGSFPDTSRAANQRQWKCGVQQPLSLLWLAQALYFFLFSLDVRWHYDLWVLNLNRWVPMAMVTVGFFYLTYSLRES